MQQSFIRRRSWRRVLLVLLILAGVGATGLISLHAQQAQTTVTVSSVTAMPGETKVVSVAVANASGVASIQGSLSFDPGVVQPSNVVFASNFTVYAFNVQSNTIRFLATLTRDHPIIQNGELFHMDGRAVGQPGQSSPLNLTLQIMGDVNFQEIPRSIANGAFTIVGPITPPPPVQTPSAKPPVADFSFTPQNPTTDDTVQFTDLSTSPNGMVVNWLWDFGDGQTASVQNPTHRYTKVGTYSVKLTVTDNVGAGASTSVSKSIVIGVASFSGKVPVVSVFPNPASHEATFRYLLPKGTTQVSLLIFNLPGAEVFQHDLSRTANEFQWNLQDDQGRDLPDGPYFFFVLAITPDGPARSDVGVLVIQR